MAGGEQDVVEGEHDVGADARVEIFGLETLDARKPAAGLNR
jgi:hypothetical protein